MKKKSGKTLMQKWKNKIGGKLSALDKKKLVLTNIPYALAAFYADRAFFLYRNSPGEDMGNKLLYAMEHADWIFAGDICYLSACEEQKYFFADKNQNLEMWNDICLGEFEVINVPGNHVTCIHSEENATLLAQIIIERNIRG